MYNLIMISYHIYLIIIEHHTQTHTHTFMRVSRCFHFSCVKIVCVRVLNSFLILFMPISVGSPSTIFQIQPLVKKPTKVYRVLLFCLVIFAGLRDAFVVAHNGSLFYFVAEHFLFVYSDSVLPQRHLLISIYAPTNLSIHNHLSMIAIRARVLI